ncbi:hypothetical protein GBAR_LOCUS18446, partial [Geodia barretti]
ATEVKVVFPGSSTSAIVTGLTPDTSYQFQVFATVSVAGQPVEGERSLPLLQTLSVAGREQECESQDSSAVAYGAAFGVSGVIVGLLGGALSAAFITYRIIRTFSEGRRYEKVAVNSKRTGVGSTCSRNSSRPGKERTLHFRDLESGRAKDEQGQGQSARNSSKGNLIDNPVYADPSSNEDLLDNLAYGDPSKGDDSAAYGDPGGNEDLLYNTAYGDCGRNDDNPAYEDLLDTPAAYGDPGGNEDLLDNPAYGDRGRNDDNPAYEDLLDTPAAYGDPGGNEDLLDNPAYGDRGRNDDTPAYGDPEGNVYIEELITNPAYGVTSSEG